MLPFKSLWRAWSSENTRPPERDEHVVVIDSILLELEFHIKELEKVTREEEQEKRRKETGVDYSWLISVPPKTYEIPQLERLEIEELCYKIRSYECGKVISLFRDAILNEPQVQELPKILKACLRQVFESRPKEESLRDWVVRRTSSLSSLRLRPPSRVSPCTADSDIESQSDDAHIQNTNHERSVSFPSLYSVNSLPI
ncbi:hypothetical protein CHS0354_029949 [Potamilus streckersoni]|uniref:Protein RD3 n=1 Tax=Potamilus streckersoni TaxID=2493646 RepID=A0AAE0VJJ9_9BIVA|nr:hypothetical protein CHS0354_029949 [Potamilus streckersoni]